MRRSVVAAIASSAVDTAAWNADSMLTCNNTNGSFFYISVYVLGYANDPSSLLLLLLLLNSVPDVIKLDIESPQQNVDDVSKLERLGK